MTTADQHSAPPGDERPAAPAPSVWDWMVPEDADRFGRDILDPGTRRRWCAAILAGGLPYLWHEVAAVPRRLLTEQLELTEGDRVLIVGEATEAIGFDEDVRRLVGAAGEVVVIDIRDRVLTEMMAGKLPQWRWEMTYGFADGEFDCVFAAQSVAHAADWAEAGRELLRVMKSGRRLVLGEIAFSSTFSARSRADVHLEYWVRKLVEGMEQPLGTLVHWDLDDLVAALRPQLDGLETFEWRGVELLWGRKP
jgi:SAM-dependent methyltransferase